ncbi:hypothetical protein HCTV-16_gp11 [Haloarcula virus HCTV-16]|nr:hypothetical protein HCTV-16_gp11 [Haloarcula virus HCTV-16]
MYVRVRRTKEMPIDTDGLDELASDDDYPSVVGGDTAEEYALDYVYAAIEDEIEDDDTRESLALLPSQYVRGSPTASDVRMILNDIDRLVGTNEEISERIEEAKEYADV